MQLHPALLDILDGHESLLSSSESSSSSDSENDAEVNDHTEADNVNTPGPQAGTQC
jgi:hypothetical protein